MNGRGFVDVTFTMPGGVVLDRNSISDIEAGVHHRRRPAAPARSRSTRAQAPLLLDAATNTYRYWLRTKGTVTGVTITFIDKSWSGKNSSTQDAGVHAGHAGAGADQARRALGRRQARADARARP